MLFEVADGEWVHSSVMSGLTPKASQDELLGLEDPPDPMTFLTMAPEEREVFTVRRREAYKHHERDELVREFQANNHAIEAVITMEEALGAGGHPHPQLVANGMVAEIDDPGARRDDPDRRADQPARDPGRDPGSAAAAGRAQHRDLRAPRLQRRRDRRVQWGGGLMGALEGVRLIDFGQYLAGPFGPMIIGDLGAEVIKVEPVTGDGMRLAGKPFFGCQRGKRDIALDLKSPDGLKIALELVERADIVHHNMTAGVANRLGIGYDDCKRVNPDVVYCNTWAYGLEGPLAHFGGLDPLYQAATGLEYEAGATHTGNAPLYYRFGMCDAANAMLSVVGRPRRAAAPAAHRRRPGAVDLAPGRRRGVRLRRAARRRRSGAPAAPGQGACTGSTRATASTRPRTAGSRSPR